MGILNTLTELLGGGWMVMVLWIVFIFWSWAKVVRAWKDDNPGSRTGIRISLMIVLTMSIYLILNRT